MLPRHPLPLTFTEPRGRNAGLGLACLALSVGAAFFAIDVTPWAWAGVALFVAASLLLAGRTLRPALLHLDEDGFEERCWPRAPRRLRWDDVERFEDTEMNPRSGIPGTSTTMVGIYLRDPAAHRHALERPILDTLRVPIDDVLRSVTSYGQRPHHLAGVLNDVLAQTREARRGG